MDEPTVWPGWRVGPSSSLLYFRAADIQASYQTLLSLSEFH